MLNFILGFLTVFAMLFFFSLGYAYAENLNNERRVAEEDKEIAYDLLSRMALGIEEEQ